MSNNSIKVTLTVAPENELFARRGLQKGGRVQKYIDSEVLRCCDSYVPMLTGKLKQSGITSTVVGSGMVHYNTPYARKNYYDNMVRAYETRSSVRNNQRSETNCRSKIKAFWRL